MKILDCLEALSAIQRNIIILQKAVDEEIEKIATSSTAKSLESTTLGNFVSKLQRNRHPSLRGLPLKVSLNHPVPWEFIAKYSSYPLSVDILKYKTTGEMPIPVFVRLFDPKWAYYLKGCGKKSIRGIQEALVEHGYVWD